jgi:serine/threonine-protein kinase
VADRGMPTTGDVIAGKYRIDSLIGEGGMGAVFSATHVHTGRRMAVKWLLPDVAHSDAAIQRLFREAQATGRIDHPNVVDVYDVGEQNGSAFLVMELLQGETLTKALERGALKLPDIIRMVMQAIDGTAAAHHHGVIHRDIKPDNIFLCRDQAGTLLSAKVLDFGISKISSIGGQVNPRLTKTGAVMGTPYYMSPEQVRGVSEIDGRVDVYAFGVILYEALTGRVPFDGKTYSALVLEIATGTPERPSMVNPTLAGSIERVILKAMARDPNERFATLDALAKALAPYTTEAGFQAGASVRPGGERASGPATTPFIAEAQPRVPVKRGPLLLAVGGAVLAAGIALAVWLAKGKGEDPAATGTEHIATPAAAQEAIAPSTALVAPARKPDSVNGLLAPDAGVAAEAAAGATPPGPVVAPGATPGPEGTPPPAMHGGAREKRREPAGPPAAPAAPSGSARSGTITSDDF